MKQTGKIIQEIRLGKGIKQNIIAQKLDISQSAYSRIEHGKCKIDIETLKKIATFLETTLEVLLNTKSVDNKITDKERALYQQRIDEKDMLIAKLSMENENLLAQLLAMNKQLLELLLTKPR